MKRMPSRAAREREATKLYERWKDVPPGTPVIVTRDDGSTTETETRSEAWLLPFGVALISLRGISGGYNLARVKLRPTPEPNEGSTP